MSGHGWAIKPWWCHRGAFSGYFSPRLRRRGFGYIKNCEWTQPWKVKVNMQSFQKYCSVRRRISCFAHALRFFHNCSRSLVAPCWTLFYLFVYDWRLGAQGMCNCYSFNLWLGNFGLMLIIAACLCFTSSNPFWKGTCYCSKCNLFIPSTIL